MDAANGGAVAGWIRGSIVFEELGDLMAESGLEERDTRGVEGGGALTIFCFPSEILRTLSVRRMILAR